MRRAVCAPTRIPVLLPRRLFSRMSRDAPPCIVWYEVVAICLKNHGLHSEPQFQPRKNVAEVKLHMFWCSAPSSLFCQFRRSARRLCVVSLERHREELASCSWHYDQIPDSQRHGSRRRLCKLRRAVPPEATQQAALCGTISQGRWIADPKVHELIVTNGIDRDASRTSRQRKPNVHEPTMTSGADPDAIHELLLAPCQQHLHDLCRRHHDLLHGDTHELKHLHDVCDLWRWHTTIGSAPQR